MSREVTRLLEGKNGRSAVSLAVSKGARSGGADGRAGKEAKSPLRQQRVKTKCVPPAEAGGADCLAPEMERAAIVAATSEATVRGKLGFHGTSGLVVVDRTRCSRVASTIPSLGARRRSSEPGKVFGACVSWR